MRTIPFKPLPKETAAPTEPATLNQRSFADSVVTDMSKEIARPHTEVKPTVETTAPEAKPTTETTAPAAESSNTESSPDAMSPEMREKVDKVKDALGKELNQAVTDPKRAAKHALHIINLVRYFAYPFLYKKILFTPFEIQQIEAAQKRKAAELGKKDGKWEPNEAEKEMLGKWEFFQKQAGKVSWTGEEIELITEVAYLKLAEIKFIRWMMENEWVIVILIIEGPRWAPIASYKMGFGEMDLGGLTSILKGA